MKRLLFTSFLLLLLAKFCMAQTTGWGERDMPDNDFVKYGKLDCKAENNSASIKNYFCDDPSQDYIAPRIADGEETVYKFLSKHLRYPGRPRKMGIQGTVVLHMTITAKAEIRNLVVAEGLVADLDQEAVRLIRTLKFASPPMIKGQPVEVCVVFPVNFKLAE